MKPRLLLWHLNVFTSSPFFPLEICLRIDITYMWICKHVLMFVIMLYTSCSDVRIKQHQLFSYFFSKQLTKDPIPITLVRLRIAIFVFLPQENKCMRNWEQGDQAFIHHDTRCAFCISALPHIQCLPVDTAFLWPHNPCVTVVFQGTQSNFSSLWKAACVDVLFHMGLFQN